MRAIYNLHLQKVSTRTYGIQIFLSFSGNENKFDSEYNLKYGALTYKNITHM